MLVLVGQAVDLPVELVELGIVEPELWLLGLLASHQLVETDL